MTILEHFNIFSSEFSFFTISSDVFSLVFKHSSNISLELILFVVTVFSLLFSKFKHFKNILLPLFSVISVPCALSPTVFKHFNNISLSDFTSFTEEGMLPIFSAIIEKLKKIRSSPATIDFFIFCLLLKINISTSHCNWIFFRKSVIL